MQSEKRTLIPIVYTFCLLLFSWYWAIKKYFHSWLLYNLLFYSDIIEDCYNDFDDVLFYNIPNYNHYKIYFKHSQK